MQAEYAAVLARLSCYIGIHPSAKHKLGAELASAVKNDASSMALDASSNNDMILSHALSLEKC